MISKLVNITVKTNENTLIYTVKQNKPLQTLESTLHEINVMLQSKQIRRTSQVQILYIIILLISTFAAFYSGFYFGYMKRENKAPEKMPIISDIQEVIETITEEKPKKLPQDDEPKGFYE